MQARVPKSFQAAGKIHAAREVREAKVGDSPAVHHNDLRKVHYLDDTAVKSPDS